MLLRALAAAALLSVTLVGIAAPTADAALCEAIVEPPVAQNTWYTACNYVDCYWETAPAHWTRDCL